MRKRILQETQEVSVQQSVSNSEDYPEELFENGDDWQSAMLSEDRKAPDDNAMTEPSVPDAKKQGKAKADDSKKRRLTYYIPLFIFIAVFLFSGYKLVTILWGYRQGAKTTESVREIFRAAEAVQEVNGGQTELSGEDANLPQTEESAYTYTSFSLAPLIEINPDTVCWLTIPGANVDHVVVQCSNNSFYLWRDFYEESNSCGTLFMDAANTIGDSLQNLIIYGHRMRDGSMFAHLDVFLDQEYIDENPTFTLYMADGEYECQVFAAYRTTTDFYYADPSFEDEEEMLAFVSKCVEQSEITTRTVVEAGDTLLTLSTCDRATDSVKGRLVVQARLIKVSN